MINVGEILRALGASAPSYDDLVSRYGLTMLTAPGDLQVENGDIAVTKDGRDLKWGETPYNALFRLLHAWQFSVPTYRLLFDLVYEAKRRRSELDDQLNNVFPAQWRTPLEHFNPETLDRYHATNDEIAATETTCAALSTALILAISGLLTLFKIDAEAGAEWQTTAPLIGGYSVGAIIEAAANNFRHRDEWAMSRPPSERQLRSIRILGAALNEPIAPDGAGHRMARDIGNEILDVLSHGDFETLATHVFTFANNVAQQHGASKP